MQGLTSTKNAFTGLTSEDLDDKATYGGNWWVSEGYFYLESIITWTGDRDRGSAA